MVDNPSILNPVGLGSTAYNVGQGMGTDEAEILGTEGGPAFREMGFSIEKITVTAKSRALKAQYSMELAQDLKAIHGLNAEAELANILSSEILAEINREVSVPYTRLLFLALRLTLLRLAYST